MGYLLIVVFTLLNLGESIAVRTYAKRHGSGGMLMNAIVALFAALFFLVTDTDGFYAPIEMIPLALINSCLFGAGFYFTFISYRIGPFGLTRLLSGFSLLFSIFYGIFSLGEKPNALTYIGIVAIFASMVLINYKKKGDDDEKGVSLKWFICIMTSVIANGFIAILTRMQQIRFNDACSNEFQFISIGGSFLILAILGVIIDRDKLPYILKHGSLYGLVGGVFNGAKNFLTLIIYTLLPLSILSPMKTGLNMIATFAMALLYYKEKYTRRQMIGVGLGVAAIILLAI